MNILVIGSGGREHAFGWKIKQSPLAQNIYFAPGNAGTSQLGKNLAIQVNEFQALKEAVLANNISLVVVGPEDPLVRGIVDDFTSDAALSHVTIVGPSKKGAALEGSKDFAKEFMNRHHIPTAKHLTVQTSNLAEGKEFMKNLHAPYVLKADGLAAGKGVLIIEDYNEACQELENMLDGKFGAAGNRVVIEEFLSGIEVSVFVLSDGENYIVLPEAKDYKRIGEGDTGLNTGGMGAVSPVPFANKEFMDKVDTRIIQPTVKGLSKEGIVYKGFIFIGLIKVNNEPYVIEYNVRMGDPETEAVLPRLKNDFVELLMATGSGELSKHTTEVDQRTAVTTVLVSAGYPGEYRTGIEINNEIDCNQTLVFHAGTKDENSATVTSGGRVFAVTAMADSLFEAREAAQRGAEKIEFEGKYFRKDIGFDLI